MLIFYSTSMPPPTASKSSFVEEKKNGTYGSLGYAGLDISFPALQRYEAEASGAANLTPITVQLYESLTKPHEPGQVRFLVHSTCSCILTIMDYNIPCLKSSTPCLSPPLMDYLSPMQIIYFPCAVASGNPIFLPGPCCPWLRNNRP